MKHRHQPQPFIIYVVVVLPNLIRLPKIKKNRNLRKESRSAQTPVLCSAVCRCVTLESRGCRPILLSPPSTVPLYSTVRETPNPSSTVCETHPCSLLHRVRLCHLSIAWLPRHPPLTVLDRTLSSTPYSLLYRARSELSRPLPWFILPSNLFPIFIKIVYIFSVQIMLSGRGIKSLSNLVIQLREVCNHPDLLEYAFDGSWLYPPVNEIVEQCENFRLLERLLKRLFARKHKVLIFSQWTKVLDILDYYFSEKGFEVCEIDVTSKLKQIVQKQLTLTKRMSKCILEEVELERCLATIPMQLMNFQIIESLRKLEEQPEWLRGGKLCGKLCDYHVCSWRNDTNVILADEIGLGKIVQSVSMLGFLQNAQQIHGPFLVVVPLSTLSDWLSMLTAK
ncbi:hypothetical protein Ahy_B10g105682 isoform B [Arachis hypogaea]|uniref:SNF2 N-terminal domain-containing protein n=1 Tax=Arachis hypogaea TaxID=3818 RepID=A0A444X8L6_ARAHY|nr:hypothetical protein Ahy_B10g105682 isoform B [Arachis hypogaea]